jgi:hypothetical protein
VALIVVTLIVFGYPIAWEALWRGRTPGKAALGLRVVTRQGAPIRFRHALVRGLIGMAEVLTLPVIGVIAMLASSNDQRLGDMAAGTLVIRERAPAQMSIPVLFPPPPGWESFVASLDVSGMSAAEYENIRSFLIRARDMAPLPRSNLASRLAGALVTRLRQPVPVGAGPELWLACVASAYQRRHGAPLPPGPPGPTGPPWGPAAGWAGGTGWGPPHPATRLDAAWSAAPTANGRSPLNAPPTAAPPPPAAPPVAPLPPGAPPMPADAPPTAAPPVAPPQPGAPPAPANAPPTAAPPVAPPPPGAPPAPASAPPRTAPAASPTNEGFAPPD